MDHRPGIPDGNHRLIWARHQLLPARIRNGITQAAGNSVGRLIFQIFKSWLASVNLTLTTKYGPRGWRLGYLQRKSQGW